MDITEQAVFCLHCNIIYLSIRKFKNHFKNVHSSPSASSTQNFHEQITNNSAQSETVESLCLESKIFIEDLHLDVDLEKIVKGKVFESLKEQPQKNVLSARLAVKKLCVDEHEEKDLTNYVNYELETVFLKVLQIKKISRKLDQMLSS